MTVRPLLTAWAAPFIALLLPGVCAAQPSVIFGNFAYAGGGIFVTGSAAARFTPAVDYLATVVKVPASGNQGECPPCAGAGAFDVAIFSDAAGVPGAPVSQTVAVTAPANFVTVSFAPVALHGGTPYWLVLTPADTSTGISWEVGGVPTAPFAITQSPDGTEGWQLYSGSIGPIGSNVQFEVDGTSPAVNSPAPVISGLSPASAPAEVAFTLTVNGFGFVQCAATQCLGVILSSGCSTPSACFVSGQANAAGTQLTATIPAALIPGPGAVTVTVQSAWGVSRVSGATSNPVPFTITNPPAPVITLLSPASCIAGGPAFTLTVSGSNLFQSSFLGVIWEFGGATTIAAQANADGTQVTATIPAALIAAAEAGVANVFVQVQGYGLTNSLPFLVLGPSVPAVNTGGVLNSGSYTTQGVAPGSIVSIFGTNLAASAAAASAVPLPTMLSDVTSVTLNNIPAGLYFVSQNQINAQVPFDVLLSGQDSGTVNIVVTRSSGTSAPENVTVAPASPGIFTTTANGLGQAFAYDNTTGALTAPTGAVIGSLATAPISISSGHALIIACTGLGSVTPSIDNYVAASDGTFRNTMLQPTVLIGGVPAQPIYSVLSPQFVSEYQIGVTPAANTPTGNAVSLQIRIGGVTTTNQVTIAVTP